MTDLDALTIGTHTDPDNAVQQAALLDYLHYHDPREAARRAVLLRPGDDAARLAWSAELIRGAGKCEMCGGAEVSHDTAMRLRMEGLSPICHSCKGTGSDGSAALGEMVRLGVELARIPAQKCPWCHGSGRRFNHDYDETQPCDCIAGQVLPGHQYERSWGPCRKDCSRCRWDARRSRVAALLPVVRAAGWFDVPGLETVTLSERDRDIIQWFWNENDALNRELVTAALSRGLPAHVRCTAAAWLAVAGLICERFPIESVEITGREPYHGPAAGHGMEWVWYKDSRPPCRAIVGELFSYLVGGYPYMQTQRVYLNRDAAVLALSAASL